MALCAVVSAQSASPSRFASGITLTDYYLPEYVRPTEEDGRELWFVGEDLIVEWQLVNTTAEAFETSVPTSGMAGLLRIDVLQTPSAAAVSLEAMSARTKLTDASIPFALPPDVLSLAPGQAIYAKLRLRGAEAVGYYDLQIRPSFRGPFPVVDRIRFERRLPQNRAARAEAALRRVARAFDAGNCALAHVESDLLLRVHPYSSAAYHYQAECARRSGRLQDAATAYAQARDMLDQRLDDLLIANKPDELKRRSDEYSDAANAAIRSR